MLEIVCWCVLDLDGKFMFFFVVYDMCRFFDFWNNFVDLSVVKFFMLFCGEKFEDMGDKFVFGNGF